MFNLIRKKGVTLFELIIASALLGLVAIGAGGIHLASRRSFIWSDREARVQDEARYAMEHMVRNIRLGNKISPTSGTNLTNVRVKIDRDVNGNPNPYPSAGDISDDTWVRYDFDSANHKILYVPPTLIEPTEPGTDVIAKDITNLDFDIVDQPVRPAYLTIDITAAHNPSTYDPSAISSTNPGVVLHSGVSLRSRARDY